MGHEELVTQQEETTINVNTLFKQIGVLWKVLAIVIPATWFIAMFVSRTDNSAANLHNELKQVEVHFDEKLRQQADSIRDNSNVNYNNLNNNFNNKIDQQNLKILSVSEKCDRLEFVTERWVNGKLQVNNIK